MKVLRDVSASTSLLWLLSGVAVVALFLCDTVTPWGVADGFPYIAVVLLSLWLPSARDTWAVTGVASVALVAGLVLSPSSVPSRAIVNRSLALLALWATAFVVNKGRWNLRVFELAVEGLPHAVLIVDAKGTISLANRQVRSVFGYEPRELIGRRVETLVPAELRGEHPRYRESFHADPVVRPMGAGRDLYALRKSGEGVPVEIGLTPLGVGPGLDVLCTVIDITERKRAERAIEVQAEELETLVSVISHDLKEPLRAVESFSRLVEERAAERLLDKERDFLRRVVAAAGRMRDLLDDIVSLSRARKSRLDAEWLEGETLVADALGRLSHEVEDRLARVVVANDLPRIRVDRTWATEAIYNLLSNALKFTEGEEPPDIEVAGYASGNGDVREVGFVVRDRGPGVSAESRERIFDMFQRAHPRSIEGTGAGLAIVKAVAERYGGRVAVAPRPGGGSEFIVAFSAPLVEEETDR